MSKISLVKKKLKSVKEIPTQKIKQFLKHVEALALSIFRKLLKIFQKLFNNATAFLLSLYERIKETLKNVFKHAVKYAKKYAKTLLVDQSSLSKFVYGGGIFNLILVLCLGLPEGIINVGINIVDHALSEVFAGFLLFAAVIQIIGSRDLNVFGWAIFWDGILRWIIGSLLAIYGLLGHLGITAGVIGLIDIYVGTIYLIRLPEVTNKTPLDLMSGK